MPINDQPKSMKQEQNCGEMNEPMPSPVENYSITPLEVFLCANFYYLQIKYINVFLEVFTFSFVFLLP